MTISDEPFVALLESHKGILYKVANAYCHERDDRADLIQEMTLQLWRSYPRYDSRWRFTTWMYRVSMNVAISFYRSGRVPRQMAPLETIDLAAADSVMSAAGDDVRTLQRLIGRLGEMDRALILLYLEGYGHDEMAEVLGISTTNVATRINRSKQRMKSDYEEMKR